MRLALATAATGHHALSAAISAGVTLLTLAIIVMLLVTRVRGRRLKPARALLGAPLILTGIGAAFTIAIGLGSAAAGLHDTTLHGIDYLIGAIDLLDSLILGTIRGFSIRLYERDGVVWSRYGPATVALWLVSILIRVALSTLGAAHHASPLIEGNDLLFMLGLTLLCQNAVVARRHAQGQSPALQ